MTTQVTVTVSNGNHDVNVQIVDPPHSRTVRLSPGQSCTEYLHGQKSIAMTEAEGPVSAGSS